MKTKAFLGPFVHLVLYGNLKYGSGALGAYTVACEPKKEQYVMH